MHIYVRPDRESIIKEFSKKMNKSVSSLIGEFIDDLGSEYNKELNKENNISVGSKGFCEGHFEKGAVYPLSEGKLEDLNGEILWVKKLCPNCIKKTVGQVKNEGGVFYVDGVRIHT